MGASGADSAPTPGSDADQEPPSVDAVKRGTMKVMDSITRRAYLVDTGAEESVYPATVQDRHGELGPPLVAANGTTIKSWGKRLLTIKLGGKSFAQEFWIADVVQPILGADFFTANSLAVDLAGRRLVSFKSGYSVQAEQAV